MSTRLIESKELVNLLIAFWIIVPLHGWNLTKHAENSICEIIRESDLSSFQNYSCRTVLEKGLSNNLQNLQLSLFCKSDNIFVFKLHDTLKNTSHYILEKRENGMEWDFVERGKIPKHRLLTVKDLKNNTKYDIRIWIIQIDKPNTYHSIITGWLKTASADKIPLPVQHIDSHYNFNKNSSSITIEWTAAEDLSCYYFLEYHSISQKHNDYFYIRELNNLYKTTIENVAYNETYYISIRACNAKGDLESIPKQVVVRTPACLSVHHNLSVCPPDMPENLTVEEIPNSRSLSYYDLKISWSFPKYLPDYYLIRFASLAENNTLDFNVSGVETVAVIKNVKILNYYYVVLAAWSPAGRSKYTLYSGYVRIDSNSTSSVPVVWISIGSLLIICLCISVGIVINRKIESKRRTDKRNIYLKELEQKCPTNETPKECQYEVQSEVVDEWAIDPKDVVLYTILGEGAFGVVRYGKFAKGSGKIEVAAKTLRSSPSREELGHFQHELETLKAVGSHPHLVSLIGICVKDSYGPMLVVEYCSRGDLHNFLKTIWYKIMNMSTMHIQDRNARDFSNKLYDEDPITSHNVFITSKDLLSFARQIAKGMEYLSNLKILHRDLAARNVLICEDMTVKVSDFGLSRDVYRDNVYRKKTGGRLPIRWMAIECLTHQQYTTQSDVWSFGILLWEIVTLGGNPYPGIQTENLPKLLKAGYRMECPLNCKQEIYTIMVNCWKFNPRDRMTFASIRLQLEYLLESEIDYLQVDLNTCVEMNALQTNSYNNIESPKGILERYVKPIWR